MPETLRLSAINRSKPAEACPGSDSYRWLERGDDPATTAWVNSQNELTQAWLAATGTRAQIRSRLGEQWNYPRFGVPFERGGHWFQIRNSRLQAQPVLYTMDTAQDEGRVLLDPNVLSDGGTVALGAISVSPDGSQVAYAIAASGSDWLTWHVRDVESGADEAGVLEWSKLEDAEWAKDCSGFYYAAMEQLLRCGDHDDRVVPSHPYKFAAALQAAQPGSAPVLLRVEPSAGHSSAGKPTAKAIAEAADRLAFLERALGLSPL